MRGTIFILTFVFAAFPSLAFAGLRAGTAKVDITPPVGIAMEGYGPRKAEGVHDPLHARVLVLDDGTTRIGIVTLDLCLFYETSPPNMRAPKNYGVIGSYSNVKKLVGDETGISNLLFVASHTHSGPEPTQPWLSEMEQRVASAIANAASHLIDVQIGVAWGEVPEGFNRRNVREDGKVLKRFTNPQRINTAPLDNSVGIIRLETSDGRPVATLVNYACHPVVLGPDNKLLSADYPGTLTRIVEEQGGGQCMFLQGAAGDINPFHCLLQQNTGGFEEVERMGRVLANEVLKSSKQIVTFKNDIQISFHTEVVSLSSRADVERNESRIKAEVNTVLIGNELALASFPGEFFVEHGLALKRRSRIKNTMFVGYCNDALGYFPTIEASQEGGYGAVWSMWALTEIGAGETLVNRALINLGYQAGLFDQGESNSVP